MWARFERLAAVAVDLAAFAAREVVHGVADDDAGDDREADRGGTDDVAPAPQRRLDDLDLVAADRLALQGVAGDRGLVHADPGITGLAEFHVAEPHRVVILAGR